MLKFTVFVVAFIYYVNANPAQTLIGNGQIGPGWASSSDFSKFQKDWQDWMSNVPPMTGMNIKDLKPAPNGHVSASSSSVSSMTKLVDGKPVTVTDAKIASNKDGVYQEQEYHS